MTTRHSVKAYSLPGMVQIAKKGGNNPNIAVEFVRMVDKEEFGIKKRSDDISETDVHDHKFIFGEPIYVKALDLDAIPLAEIIRLCDYPNTEKWRDYEVKWNPRNTGYDEATLEIKVRRCDFTWRNYFFSRMQLGKIIHAYICRFSVTALQYYRLQLGEIGFLRDNNNNKITK